MADAHAAKAAADAAPVVEPDPAGTYGQEPVTAAAVIAVLGRWADGYRSQNRMNESTLFNRECEFDAATLDVRLPLDNKVQLDRFGELKPELLPLLRKAVRNGRVTLTAYVTQRTQERRLYTDSDKLAYLVERHPAVAELRERLHLEPNF